MVWRLAVALALALAAGPALATPLDRSIRPEARPGAAVAVARVSDGAGRGAGAVATRATPPVAGAAPGEAALARSLRPEPRPMRAYRTAALSASGVRTQPSGVLTGKRGAVCGDPAIRGEVMAPIPGRVAGCGVDRPVRVTAVDGIPLSQAATIDCETARALRRWVAEGVRPAIGTRGGGPAAIEIAAHYACRTRNNQAGAKISEHGRGRAVDVAAVRLRDGSTLRVAEGWRDPAQGKLLRRMHAAACGPFGTVLGPNSDRFHQDHFHLDTARYRSGPYCR